MSARPRRLAHLLSPRHPPLDAAAGRRRHVRADVVGRLRRAVAARRPFRRHPTVNRRAQLGYTARARRRPAGRPVAAARSAASTTRAAGSRSSARAWRGRRRGGHAAPASAASASRPGSFDGMSSGYATDDLTVYANHVAPFVATTLSLFGERLTVTPQMRAQVTHVLRLPGQADALHTPTSRPIRACSLRYKLTERVALKGAIGALHAAARVRPAVARVRQPGLVPQRADPLRGRRRRRHHAPACASRLAAFWKDMRDLVVPRRRPGGSACW